MNIGNHIQQMPQTPHYIVGVGKQVCLVAEGTATRVVAQAAEAVAIVMRAVAQATEAVAIVMRAVAQVAATIALATEAVTQATRAELTKNIIYN